jgi:Spy/CpxP family protein refolding chaperone
MKPTFKIILLFVITFLLGGMTGYFMSGLVNRSLDGNLRSEVRSRDVLREDNRAPNEDRFRQIMIDELELKPEQVDTFFAVTRQSRRTMRQIMESSREQSGRRVRAEVDTLNRRLSGILTPEQQEKWDKMQERFRRQQRGNRD